MTEPAPRNPSRSSTPRPSEGARTVSPGSSPQFLLGIGLVSIVCLSGFVAAIVWIGHSLLPTNQAAVESDSAKPKPVAQAPSGPPARQVGVSSRRRPPAPARTLQSSKSADSPKVASEPEPQTSHPKPDPALPSSGTPTPAPNEQRPASVVDGHAFEEIEQGGRRFSIPPFPTDPAHSGDWLRLASVKVASPANLSLTILGAETAFGKELQAGIARKSETATAAEWTVLVHSKVDVSASGMPIGTFALDHGSFRFRWDSGASASVFPGRFRYCLLRLEYEDQHVDVALSAPVVKPLAALNVKGTQFLRKDPRDAPTSPPIDQLHFEAILAGLPGWSIPEKRELLPSTPALISLADTAGGKPLLDLELRLVPQDDSWNLRVTYLGHIPSTHRTTHQKEPEDKPRPCSLPEIRAQRKRIQPLLGSSTTPPVSRTTRSGRSSFESGPTPSKQRSPLTRLNELKSLDATLAKIEKLLEDIELGTQIGLRVFYEIEGQNVEVLRSE